MSRQIVEHNPIAPRPPKVCGPYHLGVRKPVALQKYKACHFALWAVPDVITNVSDAFRVRLDSRMSLKPIHSNLREVNRINPQRILVISQRFPPVVHEM